MKGLLATNGTIPSSSYAKALSPPIHTSTRTSPARVTLTPTRSSRAASSNSLLTPTIGAPSLSGCPTPHPGRRPELSGSFPNDPNLSPPSAVPPQNLAGPRVRLGLSQSPRAGAPLRFDHPPPSDEDVGDGRAGHIG